MTIYTSISRSEGIALSKGDGWGAPESRPPVSALSSRQSNMGCNGVNPGTGSWVSRTQKATQRAFYEMSRQNVGLWVPGAGRPGDDSSRGFFLG